MNLPFGFVIIKEDELFRLQQAEYYSEAKWKRFYFTKREDEDYLKMRHFSQLERKIEEMHAKIEDLQLKMRKKNYRPKLDIKKKPKRRK